MQHISKSTRLWQQGKKSYFPFSHAHRNLLYPCHTGHLLLGPLQGAAQRSNNKGNILFPQDRNHCGFSELFTSVCSWQSKDQIREGMDPGEGRRAEQITVLCEKHLDFFMPCCFGTCICVSDPAGPVRAGDCRTPLLSPAAEP